MTQRRELKIAIIGAGASGLCMAVKLQDAGIHSYTVYEKADEVGGTWRDNTYPGLTCDVPSRFYCYSFAPNPKWSRLLSPGPELQEYFRRVADERGVRRHIRFGCDVTKAEYDDGKWHLSTTFGEETFDVVITATGVLSVPKYPEIPGRETFAGPAFHSSRWDHSVSLPDKRIGLIGNGSSGVQIVAELGDGKVHRLTLFQRTAQWVMPLPNARYSGLTRHVLSRFPVFDAMGRWFWGTFTGRVLGRAPVQPGLRRSLVQAACRWNLSRVRDPELRAKLTPTYEPMCKRLAMSGRFYRSVQHPTVDVVTDRIERIEPRGIVTADGTLHELDLLVYATGFDARAYVRPMEVVGEGGITLEEVWADGLIAYRSVAVPRFPNLFMLMGPHSPIGNQSFIAIAEDQADYAIWWIKQLRAGAVRAAAPTEAATKEYNEQLKAAIPQTIWASGCNSWYVGKDGLPEVFPWVPEAHTELLRRPDLADFDVRTG